MAAGGAPYICRCAQQGFCDERLLGLIIAGFDVSFACILAALLNLFLVYFARLTIADVSVKKRIVDAVLIKLQA